MKRYKVIVILIIILLMIPPYCIFSEDIPRIWFYTDAGSGGGMNVGTVNLENAYYLPKYSTNWDKNSGLGDPVDGTYSKAVNVVGNVGIAYTGAGHDIKFTVSTNGRFECQTDPTKYVDFYVALKPRVRWVGGSDDYNYLYDPIMKQTISPDTRVPNTNNSANTASVVLPGFNRENSTPTGETNGQNLVYRKLLRCFIDLLVCINPLSSEDLRHVVDSKDYVARIDIYWECLNPNCKENHFGSYSFSVRGHYGVEDTSKKSVFVYLTPDPDALNLDILNIIDPRDTMNHERKIATLKVISTPTTTNNNDWDNLKIYVSTNSDYTKAGSQFVLQNVKSGLKIPYTIVIKAPSGSASTSTEFTGTDKYAADMTNKVNVASFVKDINNKQGNPFNSIDFAGDVYIRIQDGFIGDFELNNGTTVSGTEAIPISIWDTIYDSDPDNPNGYIQVNDAGSLAGIYTSTIYYHVVYGV